MKVTITLDDEFGSRFSSTVNFGLLGSATAYHHEFVDALETARQIVQVKIARYEILKPCPHYCGIQLPANSVGEQVNTGTQEKE